MYIVAHAVTQSNTHTVQRQRQHGKSGGLGVHKVGGYSHSF